MILKNTKFKYSKAREMILDAILSGNLESDSILPSEQKLCTQLGVSRITLRAALRELEQDGIIIKQNGRPSRVNPEALRANRAPLRRIVWVDANRTNPIYFEIFRTIIEGIAGRNVKLDYISLGIDAMAENFFLKQHEYDGLILGQITPGFQKYLPQITHKNSLCIDCIWPGFAHCVKTDSYHGGTLAARTLAESGHKRPIFLGYTESMVHYKPFEERFHGFCDSLNKAGIPLPEERILRISSEEEEKNFSGFLKRHLHVLKKADSIFAVTDNLAVSLLYTLPKMGVRIPQDLSVIGFDGLPFTRFVSPVLTTVRQPVEEIGRKALEIILNPSESASFPECLQIPPVLETGDSVLQRI